MKKMKRIKFFRDIHKYFDSKNDNLKIFSEQDVRVEGWFKGELLVFLSKRGIRFEREKNLINQDGKRNNIDFKIRDGVIELKSLCVSKSKRTPRDLKFYFREDNVGIYKDFKKLEKIKENYNKYVLAFVYPKEKATKLDILLKDIEQKYPNWKIVFNKEGKNFITLVWKMKK